MIINNEQKLELELAKMFPFLSYRETNNFNSHSQEAYSKGYSQGNQLSINKALDSKLTTTTKKLL